MATTPTRVLVVGATGRTGGHVMAAAAGRGLTPVALARDEKHARDILPDAEIVVGDLEDAASLATAVQEVDGIIFVRGSDNDSRADSVQRIDYGGVVNVMRALGDRKPRIVLQTSIFVTRRDHYLNAGGHPLDWKRRSERVVRLSGAPYTIVRPGWLEGGVAGGHVTTEQGDTGEGGISREVLGTLLTEALLTEDAPGRTFEACSGPGRTTRDWAALFGRVAQDAADALDAVEDTANMPLEDEPARLRSDLAEFRAS